MPESRVASSSFGAGGAQDKADWLSLLSICWLPKFDSTLQILFLTVCAVFLPGHSSQPAQTIADEEDLPICQAMAVWVPLEWPRRKNSTGSKKQDDSVISNLGNQQMGRSDSHFRLILGLPYTITINIPWIRRIEAADQDCEKYPSYLT